jgi:hypothetical protein
MPDLVSGWGAAAGGMQCIHCPNDPGAVGTAELLLDTMTMVDPTDLHDMRRHMEHTEQTTYCSAAAGEA